ncbi:MAG: hypothetical protein ACP5J4_11240, partial [Anaerolineae bacterium]
TGYCCGPLYSNLRELLVQYKDAEVLSLWRKGLEIAERIEAKGKVIAMSTVLALVEGQTGAEEKAQELLRLSDQELTRLDINPQMRSFLALIMQMVDQGKYPM